MAGLSSPISKFGLYSIAFINPKTGLPFGPQIRVGQNSSLSYSGENIENRGGASKVAYDIEGGDITAELAFNFTEFPSYIIQLFNGGTLTNIAASIGEFVNPYAYVGTSILDAANGIDSIGALAGSEANVKSATYLLVATGVNTADVYCTSDVDFRRGVAKTFLDDSMKILENIDLSANYQNADFGLDITIVGVPAFTTGDVIEFRGNGANSGGYEIEVGAANDSFPEFRAVVIGELQSTGVLFEIDCYRCSATGAPLNFARKEFAAMEVTAGLKLDSGRNSVFKATQLNLDL